MIRQPMATQQLQPTVELVVVAALSVAVIAVSWLLPTNGTFPLTQRYEKFIFILCAKKHGLSFVYRSNINTILYYYCYCCFSVCADHFNLILNFFCTFYSPFHHYIQHHATSISEHQLNFVSLRWRFSL